MSEYNIYYQKIPEITLPEDCKSPQFNKLKKNIRLRSVLTIAITYIAMIVLFVKANYFLLYVSIVNQIIDTFDLHPQLFLFIAAVLFVILLLVLNIVHEFLHMVLCIGRGDIYAYLSFKKKVWLFSLYCDCELSGIRFLFVKLLPVLIISGGLFVSAIFISGVMGELLKLIAFFHLAISSTDIVTALFLLNRSPSHRNALQWEMAGVLNEILEEETDRHFRKMR
jgi:hypothetical protein